MTFGTGFFCIQHTSLAVHEIVLCINNLLLLISGYYSTFLKAINPLNPGGSEVKASAWNVGDPGSISDLGSIPGSGRSPGEGNGNPLQYSCLENPRDGGAWWAAVYGAAQSWTRLK